MNCSKARKLFYAKDYPFVFTPDLLEAKRHIEGCSECKRFFEEEERFVEKIRELALREKAPDYITKRVLGKRAEKRKDFWYIAVIVFFLVVSSLILYLKGKMQKDLWINLLIKDYMHVMHSPRMQVASGNLLDIKRFFSKKVSFPVNPPSSFSAELEGGRLCILKNVKFALLFYRHRNYLIPLFITGNKIPPLGKREKIDSKKVYVAKKNGYVIIQWLKNGLTYIVVSDLDLKELKELIL